MAKQEDISLTFLSLRSCGWQRCSCPQNVWVLFWAERIITSWNLRCGLKGLRSLLAPFTGWCFSDGHLSWKVSPPSLLPWLLLVVACHSVSCSRSVEFVSVVVVFSMIPQVVILVQLWMIGSRLGRGRSGFVTEPCQNKHVVWLLLFSLFWGRVHYTQLESKRYFCNLGWWRSDIVPCPSLPLCPQLESDWNIKFPTAN